MIGGVNGRVIRTKNCLSVPMSQQQLFHGLGKETTEEVPGG